MAEFGSLDPNDWREQEAQEGLALQQKDAEALAAKQRSWADTGRGILSAPYRLAKGLGSSGDTGQPATGVANWVGNAASNLGGAIKSGFTAPGDVVSGAIPEYTDGHTSPEMIHRAFDTSAMAGGASFGGKAAAAPVVAADSAKAALPVAAAEHAPPFYSALELAVAEHPQEVAPAKQWLGTLSNKPGVKPDELKYTGTADMLAKKGDQPVTKAELQDHLEQNKIQLGEVTKGQMPEKWQDVPGDQRYAVSDMYNDLGARHSQPDLPEWYENIAQHSREGNETGLDKVFRPAKFAEYQLPGGENYREKLLMLPSKSSGYSFNEVPGGAVQVLDSTGAIVRRMPNMDAARAWAGTEGATRSAGEAAGNYHSSHWDEPNVLAHLRMNDRDVTGAGESAAQKALHLEEIQSDWHQQGREKGYVGSEPQAKGEVIHDPESDPKFPWRVMVDGKEWNRVSGDRARAESELQDGIEAANRRAKSGLLPDAPFKKNWHELALKRALHDAAEGGYERLSWTPGEAQAARYDLSKHADQVKYNPKDQLFVAQKNGRSVIQKENVKPEDLPNIIGKDVARKLLETDTGSPMWKHSLEGQQLAIGGEGMKGFYDKIVPDHLNKIGKPHGVQVKQGSLHTEVRMYDNEGKPGASFPSMYAAQQWLKKHPDAAEFWSPRQGGAPVHYMDIPPSLKQQLLTKGMPLFEDSSPGLAVAAAADRAPGAKGLSFPAEEAADRLRLKTDRERKAQEKGTELAGAPANPRTVLKAPKGSGLPDFATGKITPEDWVKRHEQILSPDEIGKSAKWYDEIYDNFLQHANGDAEKAAKYMRAWLVSQQNIDVSGAMANTLLQREQINRGVPESQMKAGGMPNPTTAARQVLQDKPVTGVGQKIADFVDAAEGKDTRSWMGNRPEGGKPFVVDVHTARDTGMVDTELVNHLGRLGYDKKGLAKLKTDLGTSPSQTQYENRAKFGHDLTDYLNQNNWQGRSDWTPKEVQAVGWMGMTKLTANKADDVVTGLQNNMRHLSMELSPGEGSPWAAKYGDRFAALPAEKQREFTHQISQDAIHRASAIAGTDVRDIVHGTGGWQNFQNPSTVAQTFSSKQGAEIAANALGHLLQQTEVWSSKVKPLTANPKGFAVDLIASGNHTLGTDAGLRDFWSKIMAADPTGASKNPLFQGYQPIKTADGRVGIRVLIDRGGEGTKAALESSLSGPIKSVLEGLPGDQSFEIRRHEAEIYKARNDWKEQPNGEGYRQRLVELVGPDRAAQLDTHGAQLEDRFRSALEAAEGKQQPAVGASAAKAKPAALKRKKSEPPFGALDAGP